MAANERRTAAVAAEFPAAGERPTPVCTRGDVIVMQDADGSPYTILNTPYNKLRHYDYAGRRIMYAFDEDNRIEETYTPGVFNCHSTGGRLVQISDTAAVTTAIVDGDRDGYVRLCTRWLSATIQRDYIATYVRGSSRLGYDAKEDAYLVDGGLFRIDKHGNAESAIHGADGRKVGHRSLCIVNTEARGEIEVVDPQLGRIRVAEVTQMIIAKLMFLLHPSHDAVFLEQLGPVVREHVDRLIAAGPPLSTYDAVPRYDDIRGGEAAYSQPPLPEPHGGPDRNGGGGRP